MRRNILLSLFVVMALLVAACGGADTTAPAAEPAVEEATPEVVEEPATDAMTDGEMMTDSMEMTDDAMMTDSMEMTDGEMMTDDAMMTDSMEMTDGEMMTDSEMMTDTAADGEMGSIVDVASEAGQFTTLLTVATEAGLAETLSTGGPFTVFAPTDDAFAAMDPATLDAAMADPEGLLTDVLLYHVVDGSVMSGDLSDGMEVTTLNGATLTITIDGDTVMVNDATVISADVEASNGVIHVIDAVLLPPQ